MSAENNCGVRNKDLAGYFVRRIFDVDRTEPTEREIEAMFHARSCDATDLGCLQARDLHQQWGEDLLPSTALPKDGIVSFNLSRVRGDFILGLQKLHQTLGQESSK